MNEVLKLCTLCRLQSDFLDHGIGPEPVWVSIFGALPGLSATMAVALLIPYDLYA